jgi:fructokinase
LLVEYGLRLICVTRGARGSLLVSKGKTVENKGFNIKVADAVGAGDAFTACLAHHYIRGESLDNISESANRFAAWVATQVGATPPIHGKRLQEAMDRAVPD